jgi:uncharacterized protein (TIGR03086 family)
LTKDTTIANRHGSAVITLPSDTSYLITRTFDAPAELVFKATTTPELVRRWWGFAEDAWVVCDIDLRVGGKWRYLIRHGDDDVGFHGEYREITRPHRLVFTEMYEGVPELPPPDAYPVNTMTLDEVDGVTTMTLLVQHTTNEERDMVLASGMEGGMQVSYDRLEDLVAGGGPASEIAERYRRVAARFSARVNEVPAQAWDNPAPCEGWVARDVVRHLVEWVPAFLSAAGGPTLPTGPSVDDDPGGAWAALSDGIEALLNDPTALATTITHPMAGTHRLDDAIAMFFMGDIVVHTWDIARAAGLDETLDADIVHDMLIGMEPLDEMLRASGQYGPKVDVPTNADEQTRLIAFTGRRP